MSELTDSQLIMLSAASQREDGVVDLARAPRGAAGLKVAESLLRRGLLGEVAGARGMPVWRRTETEALALRITSAGLLLIGVDPDPEEVGFEAPAETPTRETPAARAGTEGTAPEGPPAPGNRDRLLALLRRPEGASLQDIVTATGWLPHSARAALSILRKTGVPIERCREHEASVYRIRIAEGHGVAPAVETLSSEAL